MAALTPPVGVVADCDRDPDLDLDLLRQLARDDAPAFEALRARLVGEFIATAPAAYQRRLNGLQFRVDQLRRLAKTPLAATIRISELMWESFLVLNRELSTPPRLPSSPQVPHPPPSLHSSHTSRPAHAPVAAATVIPLRRVGPMGA